MQTDTIKYKGHTIEILHDDSPSNPLEDSDCYPPTLVIGPGGDVWEYGLDFDLPELTREQIKANVSEIAVELGFRTLLPGVTDYVPKHIISQCVDGVEVVNLAIEQYYVDLSASDKLRFLELVYSWQGMAAIYVYRTGYSQGDWLEFLIVATPEWLSKIGCEDYKKEDLEYCADDYAAYAFGDCYYYTVSETEDSCGGFLGSDHEKSGLLEQARGAIDCEIRHYAEEMRKASIVLLSPYGGVA